MQQAVGDGGFPVGHVELWKAAEHDMRRFRVEADVEFGRRGDVAVPGQRPAHHHQPRHPLRQGRIQRQRQRQIGQRTERHQQQLAGVFVRQAQDGQCSMLGLGSTPGRRQADIAETVDAMHMRRVHRRCSSGCGQPA